MFHRHRSSSTTLLASFALCVLLTGSGPAFGVEFKLLAHDYLADWGPPAWAPDGSQIASLLTWINNYFLETWIQFVPLAGTPHGSIWAPGVSSHPSWSPDSRKIAFANVVGIQVWDFMAPLPTPLQASGAVEVAWSPGGDRIAFVAERNGNIDLWTLLAAGGGEQQLTMDPGSDIDPAWSPDATKIAFASNRSGNYDIWVMPANGGSAMQVTDDPASDRSPSWSKDGNFLAFESERSGNRDIWVVRASGGVPTQVTSDPAADMAPAWSPDGTKIAFLSDRSGAMDIWLASDLRTISIEPSSWSAMKSKYR